MGPILERFGGPKSNQNRHKIGLKSDHSKKTRIFVSTHKNEWFLYIFHSPGGQKSTKNRLKSDLKLRCQKNTQQCRKKWPTWLQHGSKLGPCWVPKSSWTGKKMPPQTTPKKTSKHGRFGGRSGRTRVGPGWSKGGPPPLPPDPLP